MGRFDWRDAYRSLCATPMVTGVALLSLALGIGANTALFSILNSLVLKPLPVHEPERLAILNDGSWTNPIWEQIRQRDAQLFGGAFAWSADRFNLSARGVADLVDAAYASGGLFDVLGVRAERGRTLTTADDRRDGGPDGPVAVISHALWQRRFGGAPDIVGRQITIERTPFTIVGVTPAGFFGPDVGRSVDVYVPIGTEAIIRGKDSFLDGRTTWWLEIGVRMKPGQTVEQANAQLRAVQPQIREATRPEMVFPNYLGDPLTLSSAASGRSTLRTRYRQPLTILMVVVGAVLLIACANIANLLLARAGARRHELVVRLALGASRLRLARQLLLESFMLALGGTLLGLGVAKLGIEFLVLQMKVSLDTSPDLRVLLFTSSVTVLTALLFGIAPAFGAARAAPNEALKEQSRSVAGDRRLGLRNTLVIVQVALSLALVVAAGLFVRTFSSLAAVPLGFNPRPLLAVALNVQHSDVAPEQRIALYARLRESAQSVPGVKHAVISVIRPLSGGGWNGPVRIPGSTLSGRQRMTWRNAITPGWFETFGIHIVEGRDVTDADAKGAQPVAVVNQLFVNRFFPGQRLIGREIAMEGPGSTPGPSFRVVGIVTDAVYRQIREGATPTMYMPLAQSTQASSPSATLTIDAQPGPREALERALTDQLSRVDAGTSFALNWYADLVRTPLTQERVVAVLSVFFGGLALLLSGLGLYGLTSYSVTRRRREIGVRMALGANPREVVRLILTRTAGLVLSGLVAGVGLSWWASKYIAASILYGLQPRDPATVAAAAAILVSVAILASWLPARRASRVDPTTVLREE